MIGIVLLGKRQFSVVVEPARQVIKKTKLIIEEDNNIQNEIVKKTKVLPKKETKKVTANKKTNKKIKPAKAKEKKSVKK